MPFFPLQSMVAGDPGRCGTPALSPAVEESRTENVSVLTPPPNMEEKTALVMALCLKCATIGPALLVSTHY